MNKAIAGESKEERQREITFHRFHLHYRFACSVYWTYRSNTSAIYTQHIK